MKILSFSAELEFHQKKGYIASSTLLLCVEDPRCKVGSGGATLNALLVVAEHLSAMSGHTVSIFVITRNPLWVFQEQILIL